MQTIRTFFPFFAFLSFLAAAGCLAVRAEEPNAGAAARAAVGGSPDEKRETADPDSPTMAQRISQHIQRLAAEERSKRMEFMEVVIDDVARLCELEDAQRDRLLLAAAGANERSMKKWHEQAERYFRSRLTGADEDTAKEILENMGQMSFGGRDAEKLGESQELWKDTLSEVLTGEQMVRYREVQEERDLAKVDAFARMSLTTIDTHLRLTPEQREQMGEVLQTSALAYFDKVEQHWGQYYERDMLMSLANASEEEDLKAILTESQFKRLKETTSSYDHFWDNERRQRRAREKAARMREEKKLEEEKGEGGKDRMKEDENAEAEKDKPSNGDGI